ncbi:hypothetical protein C8Q79DRAFT_206022 [Trametes meyenii]|nr:hypothetical protein C8Q79DRAFT_206022 [Trametes meyenii]
MAALRTLSRLADEIHLLICEKLDIAGLVAMREVNQHWYGLVQQILIDDRERILRHFVREPSHLLKTMARFGAVIGNWAALAFIIRDCNTLSDTLDIYVPREHVQHMEATLALPFSDDPNEEAFVPTEEQPLADWTDEGSRTCFRTFNGRKLVVHGMTDECALRGIVSARTTALINFLGPYSFGCGYPSLTLQRRSLAPLCPAGHQADEADSLRTNWGFDIASVASDFVQPIDSRYRWGTYHCERRSFECPIQPRFFGDMGSLMAIMDPLHTDVNALRDGEYIPFAPNIIWRMDGPPEAECDRPCRHGEALLPAYAKFMTAVIVGCNIKYLWVAA